MFGVDLNWIVLSTLIMQKITCIMYVVHRDQIIYVTDLLWTLFWGVGRGDVSFC